MSDPWARPADARPRDGEVIEIDLVGSSDHGADHHQAHRVQADSGQGSGGVPVRSWRKVVALSSVAGLVVGAIVAAVMSVRDDEAPPSPTTLPRDELAALLTTPPTLPPVGGPDDLDGTERTIEPIVSIPSFPSRPAVDSAGGDAVRLVPPDLDVSREVTIITQRSGGGSPIQTRIAYDASSDRYELAVDLPLGTGRTIYDPASGSLFEQEPSVGPAESWRQREADGAFAGLLRGRGISIDTYFEQLLLGPVRADNLGGAISVTTDGATYDVAGVDTRRFVVTLPSDTESVWQISPRSAGMQEFEVYVDDAGRFLRTQGVAIDDDEVVALQHVLSYSDDVPIPLPDPDTVIRTDVTGTSGPSPGGVGSAASLRPAYDEFVDRTGVQEEQFDVGDAFAHLFSRPPAASTVDVIWAAGRQRFVSQRDDANDRRSMVVTSVVSDDVTIQIDDGASATSLLTDDQSRNWTRLSTTGLGGRRLPVDERLISGPLTATAVDRGRIEPGRFVTLADGTVAREVRLLVQPGDLLLPSIVPMELEGTEPVEVYVYVGAGVVHEIHVLSNSNAQVFVQVFDLRADPEIGLPDPAKVSDG